MLPLISFETGRKTPTQSSGRQKGCASKWKSGSIRNRNHGREANTRGEESERTYTRAPPTARRESFCPLDKDLSWKSDYRTLAVPGLHLSGKRVYQELSSSASAPMWKEIMIWTVIRDAVR